MIALAFVALLLHNPVYTRDFPDPFVLKVGATYYAYATNGNGSNV
jgi:beta-xylosidase